MILELDSYFFYSIMYPILDFTYFFIRLFLSLNGELKEQGDSDSPETVETFLFFCSAKPFLDVILPIRTYSSIKNS
jgi:hypothetical protein